VDASAPVLDAAPLAHVLAELTRLLRDADMRALDVHTRLQAARTALPAADLRDLEDAMAALDFKRALACCDRLIRVTQSSKDAVAPT